MFVFIACTENNIAEIILHVALFFKTVFAIFFFKFYPAL